MLNSARIQTHKAGLFAGLAVSLSLLATSASEAASARSLVIPGHGRALAAIGRGVEPGLLHFSPNPYERNKNIAYYQSLIRQSRSSPLPQRITGTCADACVMKLAIRGACVDPNAELWFLPALNGRGIV